MKKMIGGIAFGLIAALALFFVVTVLTAEGQERVRGAAKRGVEARDMGRAERLVTLELEHMDYRPAPEALPQGAEVSVLRGDPRTGPYTLYLYMPENYQIPAHWHSDTETANVVTGVVHFGPAEGALTPYHEGAFLVVPARHPHRARCLSKGGCIISLSRGSAFDINYLNPADDPRRQLAPPAR
ncbi:MAG: cupin domain-containing protein [Deltaproteobacteria bacterium]|nr:cupin domain-containing protein [Deltaproteobacteria bacterium]